MTKMLLKDYLAGMAAATIADELDAAIQAPFQHPFIGPTWSRICRVQIEAGNRIVAASPVAFYVPRMGARRQLMLCGESYKVAAGGNSAGVRYAWAAATEWAIAVLMRNGFSKKAAVALMDSSWRQYPHRSISIVEKALAGKTPDRGLCQAGQ